jgi:hypothetical protein
MEETALGQSRSLADVLNARSRIALGANDIERGIEDFGSGIVMRLGQCGHGVPTSWYEYTNWSVCSQEKVFHRASVHFSGLNEWQFPDCQCIAWNTGMRLADAHF